MKQEGKRRGRWRVWCSQMHGKQSFVKHTHTHKQMHSFWMATRFLIKFCDKEGRLLLYTAEPAEDLHHLQRTQRSFLKGKGGVFLNNDEDQLFLLKATEPSKIYWNTNKEFRSIFKNFWLEGNIQLTPYLKPQLFFYSFSTILWKQANIAVSLFQLVYIY